jgi:hypothetical protein
MMFRGIRLGAVLLPLGVAIIPVSVLLWYGFVRIPTQEAYLNARNLRLLTTLSGVIKAKVESFDGALDHAVRSYVTVAGGITKERFQEGVGLFAPELQVLALDVTGTAVPLKTKSAPESDATSEIEKKMLANADDPPRVQIERDEGRYYLYLGAKQEGRKESTVRVVARADIDAVVMEFLSISPTNRIGREDASQEFAAILLTTSSGEVIAQASPVGLKLARLDGVVTAPHRTAPNKEPTAQPVTFNALSMFSNMVPVTIGEVEYKLYLQPVSLSLLSMNAGNTSDRNAEQWALCGLVRADRFRADSASLSYTTLLWFSTFLALLALAIPFVKLRALNARERLRASDAAWVTATTFAAIALLTLGTLDVLAFGWEFGGTVDERLKSVAGKIASKVTDEVGRIEAQAMAFESDLDGDGTPMRERFAAVTRYLESTPPRRYSPQITVTSDAPTFECVPVSACTINLLSKDLYLPSGQKLVWDYPFFELVTWAGDDGWQRVRKTPGPRLRPFVNIIDEKLPYAEKVRAAWQTPRASPTKGIDVVSSPNTGEPLTVFWQTGETQGGNRKLKWVQSLAMTSLVSLDRPLLPKGVSFAVVDRSGKVLFHSDRNRRLRENFFKECENDAELRSALQSGSSEGIALDARYLGRPNRLYVVPLTLPGLGKGDPRWRLVVLQDAAIGDTVNLETLTIACWLFAFYSLALALAATLIYGLAPDPPVKWFWPYPGKRSAYRSVALLNGAAAVVFVIVFVVVGQSSTLLLVATAALVTAVVLLTRRVVVRSTAEPDNSQTFEWWHPFFLARAAFLLVVVVLPAVACFEVAYAFEATLLVKSENAQRDQDSKRFSDRIVRVVALLEPDARKAAPLEDLRRRFASADTFVPLWPGPGVLSEDGRLERTLSKLHRKYNDIAMDLESSIGGAAVQQPPTLSGAWLVAILGVMLMVCYAFVYWLVKPLFALDAVVPPVSTPGRVDASSHVLVIGPPGSGKSTSLARDRQIRVFDVAMLTYVERRKKVVTIPIERRRVVGAVIGAVTGAVTGVDWDWPGSEPAEHETPRTQSKAAGWADTFDYSTLPPHLGIDHLDYRLEEREFAAQTLKFLERAIYRDGSNVRIVADRDPLGCLRDSGAPDAEVERWVRVLSVCRKEVVAVDRGDGGPLIDSLYEADGASSNVSAVKQLLVNECRGIPRLQHIADELLSTLPESTGADDVVAALGSAAAPYYQGLWNACSSDERFTLLQLAEEGLVNPQNQAVVRNLLRARLVVRNPEIQIMNKTFGEFVRQAASGEQVSAWEHRGVMIPWGSIEIAMLTVVVILGGLLIVTQEQLLNAWIGFLPAFLPAGQKLWNAFASLRGSTKEAAFS